MPKFNFYRASSLAGAAATVLYQLYFSDKKKSLSSNDKIILSQNSGLFSAHTAFFQNSIVCENVSTKIVLVTPPFWLDEVDESRLDTEWGQLTQEYPLVIRERLKTLLEENKIVINENERLTFRQMRMLRDSIKAELKSNKDFEVIEDRCSAIQLYQNKVEHFPNREEGLFSFYPYRHSSRLVTNETELRAKIDHPGRAYFYFLKLNMEHGKAHVYEVNTDMRIYNFASIPRPNLLMQELNNGKDLPPQTELYKLKRGTEPKNIITFGGGLAAVWVCEQARQSNVHIVLRNRDTKLDQPIERNKNTIINPDQFIYANETDFILLKNIEDDLYTKTRLQRDRKTSLEKYAQLHNIDLDQQKTHENYVIAYKINSAEVLFAGIGYNATGFIPNLAPVKDLPKRFVNNVHFNPKNKFSSPKNLPGGALFDRYNEQLRYLAKSKNSLFFIDIEAPFIREEDGAFLAEKLETNIDFIHFMCENIPKLEDTPTNPQAFFKEQFLLWQQARGVKQSPERNESFNKKVDELFEERSALYKPIIELIENLSRSQSKKPKP